MALKVIDVYSGSGVDIVNSTDADAVIVKISQGTGYVSPVANAQYAAAKAKGKLLGIYHYAGGGDPVAEANYFYANAKNYFGEAIPALDWEAYQNSSWGSTSWARKFVDRIHELSGVWPIIYVQASAINQVANCANDCGLWVAGYPTDNNSWDVPAFTYNISPWKAYTLWQFSSSGGRLDRSVAAVDANGWKAIARGSGKAPSPAPAPAPSGYSTNGKTLDNMISDTLNGKTGNGSDRQKNLGKFYNAVQAGVNVYTKADTLEHATTVVANEVLKGVFGVDPTRKQILGGWYPGVQAVINKTAAPTTRYYTVKPGDSFWGIGQKLGINMNTLAAKNGMTINSTIYPGQKLKY
jgi:GH25 family lysozyme M1 (1,4-beta-N-acetylmuramidase)/LysM repeat protein